MESPTARGRLRSNGSIAGEREAVKILHEGGLPRVAIRDGALSTSRVAHAVRTGAVRTPGGAAVPDELVEYHDPVGRLASVG